MTIRYVGSGGSDANNGLTWSTRKLTLNGAEDTPVAPGDTVYVGAGTYRETLTVDVSGTFGNQISYIGDYAGQNTDGVGGVVRVTGSNDDKTAARTNCITATNKGYRTFSGFVFDTTSGSEINQNGGPNWIIDKCYFTHGPATKIDVQGSTQANNTIQNCVFIGPTQILLRFQHSVVVDNSAHVVQNCLFIGGTNGVRADRVGGITVKNCTFVSCGTSGAVRVVTALTVGQTLTVNNCNFQGCGTAVQATTTAEFVENYNSFYSNTADRTNVNIGANSNAFPALFDSRWFFQLTHAGAGPYNPTQFSSPFDLSSQSQIINVTGTNPAPTDMRGTAIQNSQREWGALEYDSTLSIKARQASSVDGGGMVA